MRRGRRWPATGGRILWRLKECSLLTMYIQPLKQIAAYCKDSPSSRRWVSGWTRTRCFRLSWPAVKRRQLQRMQASLYDTIQVQDFLGHTLLCIGRLLELVRTSHLSLAFCCGATQGNMRKKLRQLDKSHNPNLGRKSKQLCIIRSATYVHYIPSCK